MYGFFQSNQNRSDSSASVNSCNNLYAIFPEDKFVPGLNFITTPDLIDESELPTLQPSGPSMWAHLPQNKSKEGIESDENVRVLSHNINNLLSQNNISDDEEGARNVLNQMGIEDVEAEILAIRNSVKGGIEKVNLFAKKYNRFYGREKDK